MRRFQLLLAAICLTTPLATLPAHAWGLGISIGLPVYPYPRPYYYPYPYYYGAYPLVYPAQAPVVVPGAPVVVQPPAVVQSAPTMPAPPAASAPAPALGPPPSVAPTSGATQTNYSASGPKIDQLLAQLSSPHDHVRRDTAMDLGRLKATKAADPLMRMLANDSSPVAREAAARALGLIGSAQSLNALIRAAQLDTDRDVRHSAQFAVEIIRTNLRGN
jgi:hypothetical protein